LPGPNATALPEKKTVLQRSEEHSGFTHLRNS